MLGAQRGGSRTLAATVIYVQNVVEKIRWNTTLFANFNALFLTSDAEHIVLDLIIDISFVLQTFRSMKRFCVLATFADPKTIACPGRQCEYHSGHVARQTSRHPIQHCGPQGVALSATW